MADLRDIIILDLHIVRQIDMINPRLFFRKVNVIDPLIIGFFIVNLILGEDDVAKNGSRTTKLTEFIIESLDGLTPIRVSLAETSSNTPGTQRDFSILVFGERIEAATYMQSTDVAPALITMSRSWSRFVTNG